MARNTTVKADPNAPAITEMLAKFVVSHPSNGWSEAVDMEAHRTFANWVGCAIGPSTHETMQAALAGVMELAPSQQASILGRKEKVDMANAAFLNGVSSHTFDFDDTHLKTIIHPAGPVASAVLALGEHLNISGRELIDALVLGIEVSCRVGNAVYPDHYDRGWHITGSTGMLGSAAACARLLKLDAAATQMALGIAASQPIGLREQFGTMTKPFHPGGAAKAGLMSALLAKHGFTASKRALEAPRGLMQVFSDKTDWSEITDNLGQSWEIALNTYKPFACGIVIHPSIDGCVQLRNQHSLKAADIASVTIRVHSLVLELTGKKTPGTGLESKFSVYHSCAVGLLYGQAGEHEYTDEVVNRAEVTALRARVNAIVDDSIDEASADITIRTTDGQEHHIFIEHAIGSTQKPMSEVQLKAKFVDQSAPIIGAAKADEAWRLARDIARQTGLKALLAAAC
ncbi:MAG: MmgE/PrpD family protein [Gammaproteobacteria bacterium]|nr:MmgE/PrpD family protein [Gammaproteobacteria bacterium]MBU0785823.1 MmgE/PrpD family protein [Gammaproteobacteria bacterium]MBU0815794.1 MmgE/PrpD family protein [Gammaproteobacteria bacterium]MBU1787333.1 MmgE/PrpD family protein [Gammaproteobacteria bacterium]